MSISNKLELINNIVAICLVLISFISCYSCTIRERKIFVTLFSLLIGAIALTETGILLSAGKDFPGVYGFNVFLNVTNMAIGLIGTFLVSYYCGYKASEHRFTGSTKKDIFIMSIPTIIGFMFLIVNFFTEILFTVDSAGYTTRNPGSYIYNGIVIWNLLMAVILALNGNNRLKNYLFVHEKILVVPVVLGMLIRNFLLPDVPVGVFGSSLSLYLVVISTRQAEICYDYLTNVFNKEYLPYILNAVNKDTSSRLVGIMMDVNNLKMINDKYGHKAGDDVILKTVDLINGLRIENSSLVRFGGDEFILLVTVSDMEAVRNIMLNIRERLTKLEVEKVTPYTLSLSMGTTVYIPGENIHSFIRRMDEQMYFEKKAYHEAVAQ